MNKRNAYGVLFVGYNEDEDRAAFNWLGAQVSFILFGYRRQGRVKRVDLWMETAWLTVALVDGSKDVEVSGFWQNFTKVEAENGA